MACPICKKRQVAMLENIVAIDRILFPETKPKQKLSEADLNQYNKVKNAMLVNLYEIYKNLDYISENSYKGSIDDINKYSYQLGEAVFLETIQYMKNPEVISALNEDSIEYSKTNKISLSEASNHVILNSFLQTALDKLMLEDALEVTDASLLESTAGELLIKAHKSFRNDLIKIAMK